MANGQLNSIVKYGIDVADDDWFEDLKGTIQFPNI
jgi:hypothetical protein